MVKKYPWWTLNDQPEGSSVVVEGPWGSVKASASQWGRRFLGKISIRKRPDGKYDATLVRKAKRRSDGGAWQYPELVHLRVGEACLLRVRDVGFKALYDAVYRERQRAKDYTVQKVSHGLIVRRTA